MKYLILFLVSFSFVFAQENNDTWVTCDQPPYFTEEAYTCEDEVDPCRCSQRFDWDPVDEYNDPNIGTAPVVYHIWRSEYVRTSSGYAGFSSYAEIGQTEKTYWIFSNDSAMPKPGRLYRYIVRACKGGTCSALSQDVIYYTALTTVCFPEPKYGEAACRNPEDLMP